ncbi:uncharacterized protein LOC114531446 [Dendronephthya gigantea]|uniref:uncharacterized protein LOC114531446 n=1 Tax=Dendronephthya gigantea TaxID=151771 RepID=UPI00106AEE09|nr:uncharacterized protein LOC114531446 [Dendronephthya gigantea]
MALIWLAGLYAALVYSSVCCESSQHSIYVSRFNGNDTTNCGTPIFPCRSISYGILQLTEGSVIYLDGKETTENPYQCERQDPGQPGIRINKSISFVSIRSRAYISCLHGNPWLVNGIKLKNGVQVSFSGLTFLNTSVRFFDASVSARDTVFAENHFISMHIIVLHLPRFNLVLDSVVFQRNRACIRIQALPRVGISLNVANTSFFQNGNSPGSILFLACKASFINIQIRNCSFKKNTFEEYGMIVVGNQGGVTSLVIDRLRMEENSQTNPSIVKFNCLFLIFSAKVFMALENGFIYKTFANFIVVKGHSAHIRMTNFDVDGFNSIIRHGGVFDVYVSGACYLFIHDSFFRNGRYTGLGGAIRIAALFSMLTIKNSCIQNISNPNFVRVVGLWKMDVLSDATNSVVLHIINSSFSDITSGDSAAVSVFANKLFATVRRTSFERNIGGVFSVCIDNASTIRLDDVNFLENSAIGIGGLIVNAVAFKKNSTFNLYINNVSFVRNKLSDISFSVLGLTLNATRSNISLKNSRFLGNMNMFGNSISFSLGESRFQHVTLDTCIFRENVGFAAIISITGQASVTFKHCIIHSNRIDPCFPAVMLLSMNNSQILITNATFENNFVGHFTRLYIILL